MVKLLRASAPAKINLFLRVTGRRSDHSASDGLFHEFDSTLARGVMLGKCMFDAGAEEVERQFARRLA